MSFQATRTVADIAADIKRTFGDESGVQVTDADILRWVNSAQVEIVSKNQILVADATTPSIANIYDYDVSSLNIQTIHSIHYNGSRLEGISFVDFESNILSGDPNRTSTGVPSLWAKWGNTITLYPTPSSDGDAIKIYYFGLPATVSALSETLSLPDNYYERILEYVLSKAYEMDENFAASDNKLNRFDSNLVGMMGDTEAPQQATYSVITVRPEDM
jgi:hypothetical protein